MQETFVIMTVTSHDEETPIRGVRGGRTEIVA